MAFASVDDVAVRLMRTLTAAEAEAAEHLLLGAQAEIEQIAATIEADMDNVPAVLRFVAIEAVCRKLGSPSGAEQTSEALGAYSYTVRYQDSTGTLLTDHEELLVRRAMNTLSGSTRPRGLVHDIYVTEPE